MTPDEHLARLIDEVGPLMQLWAVYRDEASGNWLLEFDETAGAEVTLADGTAVVVVALASLPVQADRARLAGHLLRRNAEVRLRDDGAAGLRDGAVTLRTERPLRGLDASGLAATLTGLRDGLRRLCDGLPYGASAAPSDGSEIIFRA